MIVRCTGCGAWLWQGRTAPSCTACTVHAILTGRSTPGFRSAFRSKESSQPRDRVHLRRADGDPVTAGDLDAIEARARAAMLSPTGQQYDAGVVLSIDVPALVAEVRSLQSLAAVAREKERAALEERDEALRHLTHAAAVEAALTSDLLAAHVEVEQLRVTRATDRNRLRHTRKALAKTRLLLENDDTKGGNAGAVR